MTQRACPARGPGPDEKPILGRQRIQRREGVSEISFVIVDEGVYAGCRGSECGIHACTADRTPSFTLIGITYPVSSCWLTSPESARSSGETAPANAAVRPQGLNARLFFDSPIRSVRRCDPTASSSTTRTYRFRRPRRRREGTVARVHTSAHGDACAFVACGRTRARHGLRSIRITTSGTPVPGRFDVGTYTDSDHPAEFCRARSTQIGFLTAALWTKRFAFYTDTAAAAKLPVSNSGPHGKFQRDVCWRRRRSGRYGP